MPRFLRRRPFYNSEITSKESHFGAITDLALFGVFSWRDLSRFVSLSRSVPLVVNISLWNIMEARKLPSGTKIGFYTIGPSDIFNGVPGQTPGLTTRGSDGKIHVTMLDYTKSGLGTLPAAMMQSNSIFRWFEGNGFIDIGMLTGHEFGHVKAEMAGIKDHGRSNDAADDLENKVRRLRDPNDQTRKRHNYDDH